MVAGNCCVLKMTAYRYRAACLAILRPRVVEGRTPVPVHIGQAGSSGSRTVSVVQKNIDNRARIADAGSIDIFLLGLGYCAIGNAPERNFPLKHRYHHPLRFHVGYPVLL